MPPLVGRGSLVTKKIYTYTTTGATLALVYATVKGAIKKGAAETYLGQDLLKQRGCILITLSE